jgi:hypothetical protein
MKTLFAAHGVTYLDASSAMAGGKMANDAN